MHSGKRFPHSFFKVSFLMQTIQLIKEMQSHALGLHSNGDTIGLVPTMGCLHEGHFSLIEIAKEKADKVIVSIFVNPVQFGPNEDFEKYPRSLDQDLEKCREHGVDFVFNPSADAIYPTGYSTYVNEEHMTQGLCGVSRPNHFRGVVTICLKLFHITFPDIVVLGQKDAQQCAVIKKMISDFNLQMEVLVGPTLRDPDGLAKSSRNNALSSFQRKEALAIPKSLQEGKKLVDEGIRQVERVVAEIRHCLSQCRRLRVIYVEVVDRETMEPVREVVPGHSMATVAVWVDQVRLIDNRVL